MKTLIYYMHRGLSPKDIVHNMRYIGMDVTMDDVHEAINYLILDGYQYDWAA